MLPIKRNLSGNATCCMVQQWHLEKANHENSKRTSSCQKLGESRAGMKPRGVLERGICYICPSPWTVEHWVDPDVNYELWVKMRFDCMATSYDQFWWECRRRGRLCAHKGGGCMCTCQSSFAQEIFDKQFVHGILRDTNSSLSWCACVWQLHVWYRLVLPTALWGKVYHCIISILLKMKWNLRRLSNSAQGHHQIGQSLEDWSLHHDVVSGHKNILHCNL